MGKGTISVVIPTFNGERYLRAALDSVFTQTRRPVEVLVVDDCSTDGTPELAEQIGIDAPVPVRVTRLSRNTGGPAEPLTIGFDAAIGDYVAALDQDDLFLPQKLERQASLLDSSMDVVFAFGACAYLSGTLASCHADVFAKLAAPGVEGVVDGGRVLGLLLEYGNFVIGFPGFTFRRSAWRAVRPLDCLLRIATDYDFLCRLCRQGRVGYVNEIHYLWRSHAGNLTKQHVKTSLETIWLLQKNIREVECGGEHITGSSAERAKLALQMRRKIKQEFLDLAYVYRQDRMFTSAATACLRAVQWGGAGRRELAEGLKIALATARAAIPRRLKLLCGGAAV